MTTDEHRLSRKTLNVIAASVIVSAVLLGLLYTVGTHRCLEKTLGFGQETMVFLENACEKYDRYEQGRKTEATHDLLAAVESFVTFLSSDRVEVNDDLIEQFVHAENLSGLMVMDSDGHMAAHYDIDGRDPLMLWRDELACSPVASMYQGSKVTYSTVDERRGVVFAVCAVPYGDGVALAYRSLVSDTADDYSYAIADVLSNSTFHQGPTVLVMEDAEIVSSNSADADVSLARLLTSVGVEWKDDGLTRIDMNVFNRCSALTEVTIPASVTEVRGFSFMGCTALTDVYYTGTQAQWDAVRIDTSYGDPFKNAAVHVDAEQHVFGAWQTVEQPGCEQPGTISRTCTNGCGLKQTAAVPALGHDWDDGVIVRAPSGVRMGERRVTCRRCGRTQAVAIPPEIAAYEQFHDIDRNAWSYDGIQYCVARGLMSGTGTHTFLPGGVTTRAQLVQVLYHLAGNPDMTGVTTPFTDLTADWYQAAVAWAYETGVVDGTSPTTFSPSRPVTREQAAVLLMRYAARLLGFAGSDAPADLSAFADGGSVSGWARAGMADAVALGLFGGTQDSSGQVWLRPGAGTTRAETAALLQRMCTKVLGIG